MLQWRQQKIVIRIILLDFNNKSKYKFQYEIVSTNQFFGYCVYILLTPLMSESDHIR